MQVRSLVYGPLGVFILLIFISLIYRVKFIPSNMTRETPHGPVFFRCHLYGARFYGLGGKCDEPLSWRDIAILGCFAGFIYYVLNR
jgi:hypothetical protein